MKLKITTQVHKVGIDCCIEKTDDQCHFWRWCPKLCQNYNGGLKSAKIFTTKISYGIIKCDDLHLKYTYSKFRFTIDLCMWLIKFTLLKYQHEWLKFSAIQYVLFTYCFTGPCATMGNAMLKYEADPASCNNFVLCYRLGPRGEIRSYKFDCAFGLMYNGKECNYIDQVECASGKITFVVKFFTEN